MTTKTPITHPIARPIIVLGLGSALMLGGAYFFEYGMGLLPCTLCYWQRYAHFIVLAFVFGGAFLSRTPNMHKKHLSIITLGGIALSLFSGTGIALWHSGVERKILPGPTTCSGGIPLDNTPEAILDQLLAAPPIPCDEIAWHLLGISMANWNLIISLFMALYTMRTLLKTRHIP